MSKKPDSRVILFFIDGLGIGDHSEVNPLAGLAGASPLAHFKDFASTVGGGIVVCTDACLGVEGRPQSASGQTTILTGVNAPKILGHHKQGFPNEKLRGVIKEFSVFKQLAKRGIGPSVFVNAYTPKFFEEPPRWKSATTCAVEAAGIPFRRLSDLAGGFALFHDFTNADLIQRGYEVPLLTPADAAAILASVSEQHSFTLYEHFITDKIGHDRDFEKARLHLPLLAEFVRETVGLIDLQKTTFILTSDHGNIEDLSVRNHTLNDVPTIIWGRRKESAARRIRDLADITPAILNLLTK